MSFNTVLCKTCLWNGRECKVFRDKEDPITCIDKNGVVKCNAKITDLREFLKTYIETAEREEIKRLVQFIRRGW